MEYSRPDKPWNMEYSMRISRYLWNVSLDQGALEYRSAVHRTAPRPRSIAEPPAQISAAPSAPQSRRSSASGLLDQNRTPYSPPSQPRGVTFLVELLEKTEQAGKP